MTSRRKNVDERPGAVPDIRTDGDAVSFCLGVPTEQARVTIRCDPDGTVSASLEFENPSDPRAGNFSQPPAE